MSKDYRNELNEMYRLMNYGMCESKKTTNSKPIVEYSQLGADGKTYGILKEGTKYYVKVAPKKNTAVLAEDFDYVGGFNNRKAFDSYTKASQELNFKLMGINESCNAKKSVSQYNLNESAEWQVNETKEMRQALNRFYELNSKVDSLLNENVHYINEDIKQQNIGKDSKTDKFVKKEDSVNMANGPEYSAKTMAKKAEDGKPAKGQYNAANGINNGTEAPFTETPKADDMTVKDSVALEEGVEDWRRGFVHDGEEELVDRSHGTQIGDTAPWTETVNEEVEDWGSAGLPGEPGTGDAKKYKEPFEKQTKQPVSEQYIFEVELGDDDEAELGGDEDVLSDLPTSDGAMEDDSEQKPKYDPKNDNGEAEKRMKAALAYIKQIKKEDGSIAEAKIFENVLNDFGKHPAYRKKPMTLPQNGDGSEWGRDWNDESTKGEQPYGRQIGHSGDPFTEMVNQITNAVVTELGKKKD